MDIPIALLIIVILILAVVVFYLLRVKIPEIQIGIYERRAAADAKMMMAAKPIIGDGIAVVVTGVDRGRVTSKVYHIGAANPEAAEAQPASGKAASGVWADALKVLDASIAMFGEGGTQIIPGNQYSSGGQWQSAVDDMKRAGMVIPIRDGNSNGTFTVDGVTLGSLRAALRLQASGVNDALERAARAE